MTKELKAKNNISTYSMLLSLHTQDVQMSNNLDVSHRFELKTTADKNAMKTYNMQQRLWNAVQTTKSEI